ncbi:uncharacterized protein LOC110855996 [Folsomia candida]|uniref:uncharacterized protein LOC110855996 n=1 Tax=Folsomia candida TaxID=158441 RepID=UPI001604A986|nr:uncharacterized protein LOC110855996 [Folsomia candida]
MDPFSNQTETPAKPQDSNSALRDFIIQLNFKQPLIFSVHPFAQQIKRWRPSFLIECMDAEKCKHCPSCIKKVSPKITEVNDRNTFTKMINHLVDQPIFAVDLEHHDGHSYSGITCLIQISTNTHNFLIDPFNLIEEIKSELKDVMQCENHIKIMHGCFNDLKWMQRDYNIFPWPVVDTQLIYRALTRGSGNQSEANTSLVNLIKKYFPREKFEKSVELTLSDFRIRPVPDNLKKYAIQDTLYLSGILYQMRQDFLTNTQFEDALINCVQEVGRKALYAGKTYPTAQQEMEFRITRNQDMVRALHAWRHDLACLKDENPNTLLPTANLIVLSRLDLTDLGDGSDLGKMYELVPVKSRELLSQENLYMMKTILKTSRYEPLSGRIISCRVCNLDTITVDGDEDWTTFSGKELNISWTPGIRFGRNNGDIYILSMDKLMWDMNTFSHSVTRKIGLFAFTVKDMEHFTHEICSFMKALERKIVCTVCHTPIAIHTKMELVFDMDNNKSANARLCCKSCLPKLHFSSGNHKKFQLGHTILQEFDTFTTKMSKQPNCKQRLTAISKMLINCEMEFMCQYCFCHLENTMLVNRESGWKSCCDGCDVLYMKTYENRGSIRFAKMDEIVSLFVKILENLLNYLTRNKVPVGFDHCSMRDEIMENGNIRTPYLKEEGRKCKRFS